MFSLNEVDFLEFAIWCLGLVSGCLIMVADFACSIVLFDDLGGFDDLVS